MSQVNVDGSRQGRLGRITQQRCHQGRNVSGLPDLHVVHHSLAAVTLLDIGNLAQDVMRLANAVHLRCHRFQLSSMVLLTDHGDRLHEQVVGEDAHGQVVPIQGIGQHLVLQATGKDQGTRIGETKLFLQLSESLDRATLRHVGQQMHVAHAIEPLLPLVLPRKEETTEQELYLLQGGVAGAKQELLCLRHTRSPSVDGKHQLRHLGGLVGTANEDRHTLLLVLHAADEKITLQLLPLLAQALQRPNHRLRVSEEGTQDLSNSVQPLDFPCTFFLQDGALRLQH
mmetsp:Transcript_63344/g.114136  ORF Transcript_63344/g.114136 Transcript_63344/m.114136 type:complete len:284 (-) Transcript_63344:327-1178(-)